MRIVRCYSGSNSLYRRYIDIETERHQFLCPFKNSMKRRQFEHSSRSTIFPFFPQNFMNTKDVDYKIADDQRFNPSGLLLFFFREKKAKKFITFYVIADGKVNLMLLFVLQCKQNEIIFLCFHLFRCFRSASLLTLFSESS